MSRYVDPTEQLVTEIMVSNSKRSTEFYRRLGFALLRDGGSFVELTRDWCGAAAHAAYPVAHGLMTRRFYSDHPTRAAYTLTDKGRELGVVVGAPPVWGARHVHDETVLVHTDCGKPMQMGYCGLLRPHCGERVRGNVVQVQQA